MSISGIQGHSLEVTGTIFTLALSSFPSSYLLFDFCGVLFLYIYYIVVGCSNLKDTEWISRQDPYVCLEYGNFRHRTKTCTGT